MDNLSYVSKAKYDELQKELESLRTSKRREVADRLKAAKEYGDLSENSEYSEAREEQTRVETRIFELEEYLRNVSVVARKHVGSHAGVGSVIIVKKGTKEMRYELVGSADASPADGKISNESPLGRAFMGREVGDKVKVKTPAGESVYEITSIE